MGRCATPAAERIEGKFERGPGCWEWIAGLTRTGYGKIGGGPNESDTPLAHRVMYEMTYGPVPEGMYVLHRCDVPSCVRPDHLFLGTQKDNMDDMQAKGRKVVTVLRGEAGTLAKLSWLQVREIRERYAAGGITQKALGREYGVNDVTVSLIVNYKTWKEVA